MTYAEALQKLAALGPELRPGRAAGVAPRKFSLEHIRTLLAALSDPQKRFPAVLIAGTNGKGSTAATLASIANAAGLKTGLYTSPHLVRVNERIRVSRVNGGGSGVLAEIGDENFGRLFGQAWDAATVLVQEGALPHTPSFFELLTATGFLYFAEQHVELAVLEVGLGGRLDATNVVEPLVSIITDIGIDHTEFLGNTIGAIAREKAGILRENGVLVTLAQHPEANAALGNVAMEKNVRGVDASRCLPQERVQGLEARVEGRGSRVQGKEASPLPRNEYDLSIEGEMLHVDSPLVGAHQQRNIALAIAATLELRANHGFAISNAAIEQGVRATEWPGRLEWIAARGDHAPLLVDVAHNAAGVWALRAALAALPEEMPRTLVFSCLADKPVQEMARVLFPLFDAESSDPLRSRDAVLLAPLQNPRAASLDELLAVAQKLDVPALGAQNLTAALEKAEAITPREGVIVATGSLFLVGELRALLQERETQRR